MSNETIDGQLFSYDGPAFQYLSAQEQHFLARPEPTLSVNIIGCGMIGMEHMRVATRVGRCRVNGVFDVNSRSIGVAKQQYAKENAGNELKVYPSLEAACNDASVDGIMICTPNYTHFDVLQVAMESGKHIFLEKPMATRLDDAYAIVQLAKTYPSVLQIGLQYRFKAIYAEALHEVVTRGSLGTIRQLSLLEHRIPFLDKVGQWNKFARFSGGTLVEKCCHYFDLLNQLAQSRPVRVYATGSQSTNFVGFEFAGESADILDNALVCIEYENGCRASFNLCMFAPMFHEELLVCGDLGRLKAHEIEDFSGARRLETGLQVHCGQNGVSRSSEPRYPHYIQDSGHSGATWFEHRAFAARMSGEPAECASLDDAFWSIVVGVAAETSVKQRSIVEVDHLLAQHGITDL